MLESQLSDSKRTSFEEFAAVPESFELVASASAIHWRSRGTGGANCAQLRAPGGWIGIPYNRETYDDPVASRLLHAWIARSENGGRGTGGRRDQSQWSVRTGARKDSRRAPGIHTRVACACARATRGNFLDYGDQCTFALNALP